MRNHLVRLAGAAVVATLLLGTAGAAAGVAAHPAGYTTPVRIASGDIRRLSMAVDSTGRIHIAAIRADGTLLHVTNRTGSFRTTTVASPPSDHGEREPWAEPSLALDEHDRVSIAVIRVSAGTGCDCTDGIFLFSDKGRSRGTFPKQPVKLTGINAHDPSLKTVGGHTYLAFRRGWEYPSDPGFYDGEVWFRTNASGSWVSRRVAHDQEAQVPTPSLRIDSTGTAWVVWPNGGIHIASIAPDGGGLRVDKVPGTSSQDAGPVLALSSWDLPQVAYVHDPAGTANDRTMEIWRGPGDGGTSELTSHTGRLAITLDVHDQARVVVGRPWSPGGVWIASEFDPEVTLTTVRVNDVAIRAPATGRIVVVYARRGGPKGIYLSRG